MGLCVQRTLAKRMSGYNGRGRPPRPEGVLVRRQQRRDLGSRLGALDRPGQGGEALQQPLAVLRLAACPLLRRIQQRVSKMRGAYPRCLAIMDNRKFPVSAVKRMNV